MSDLPPGSVDWRRWMRTLGGQQRRIRTLLGLSQEDLARLSGVSQGSVSRLESGRGLATPLLVVRKVHLVLASALRAWMPLLNEGLRRQLEADARLEAALDAGAPPPGPGDEDVRELIRLYEAVPPGQRGALLSVLRATAGVLAAASGARGEPRRRRAPRARRKLAPRRRGRG